MPTALQDSTRRSHGDLLARLQELVAQNRRRWRTVILLEGLGLAVAAPLAYLWLALLIDNQFHLPLAGRLLAELA